MQLLRIGDAHPAMSESGSPSVLLVEREGLRHTKEYVFEGTTVYLMLAAHRSGGENSEGSKAISRRLDSIRGNLGRRFLYRRSLGRISGCRHTKMRMV